ncbi:hypothetical protein HMPREF0765_2682 [Sphingobacterium spiritivorum ATCC 33300]|uniref:DUF721 domain-containing protein n=3 Tax=Sphingobacterium spiritivorum TaxID=258 RepID=D7VGS9_SPHSI|nr:MULTISPECIES: DUF721 domain-containing protein [Sphingobacterium]EEI91735.1 hypothetical protein HMPREF0765_2682 [Sphingobacterium spiritivorum ATCC 33300]EFK59281.1 hypothetical protein HMPREF0766_10198 [Sphingobacterium spiritivorum ATCC 33861]QQS97113.1 DUF721 domain-containing protein [Sphingobacterium spiritivorum]QQT24228.1 DUF721 domain-containing protein [Sphingobacterium spiritivorum]QQT34024.1 DUF721 domain-containing protein [Sphingobacterium spiritivorum]
MYKKKVDEIHSNDDIGIKQAIEKWVDTYRLRRKFDESSIVNAWPEIIGKAIANRTQKIYIKDRKMYVKVESAVIKNELALMRRQIIGRLNEYVGQVVIEELIIL